MSDRGDRPPGHVPAIAISGDLAPGVLTAAGWRVTGRLPRTPYDDPRDAPGYLDLDELLADRRVDAVALDGADPVLADQLPALRRAGLLVLLTTPAPTEPEMIRRALAVLDAPVVAVAFLQRWEAWVLAVSAALDLVDGPPVQVTVRGWPRGPAAAAELVDLVGSWCGDVVSVAGARQALPAGTLPGGAQVGWSLLTACGATVLVSHDDAPPLVRLSFPAARLAAGPLGARWEAGAELPLPALPRQLALPDHRPPPPGTHAGLVGTAYALACEVAGVAGPGRPEPAGLGDLLAAARVLQALRESAGTGVAVRTG